MDKDKPIAKPEIAKIGDRWETPTAIFAALDTEFNFDLDVAADDSNRKTGPPILDGLDADWAPDTVFCNPPYSRPAPWLQKAAEEAENGATAVLLITVATDTKYWREWALKADEIRFITGRLRFEYQGRPYMTARGGSAILVYRPVHLRGRRFGPAESYIDRDKLIEAGREALGVGWLNEEDRKNG